MLEALKGCADCSNFPLNGLIEERSYPAPWPAGTTPAEAARWILRDLKIDGPHFVQGSLDGPRLGLPDAVEGSPGIEPFNMAILSGKLHFVIAVDSRHELDASGGVGHFAALLQSRFVEDAPVLCSNRI